MKKFKLSFIFICMLTLICDFSWCQPVTPQLQDGKYNFQVANVFFEVDPSFGARISSFKIDDEEILFVTHTGNDYLWGSTFWQSPQSEWNWPPSLMLDQNDYTGGINGNVITLKSEVDVTYSHLIFKKTFSADLSDTSVSIVYTMINKGTGAHSFSGWEVSRVPAGGMSFFPIGEGDVTGEFATQTDIVDDIVWYEYQDNDPASQKFFCDGSEGWSAHLNDASNIFIKRFSDAAANKNATGEKEIELWYNGPGSYLELENQSEYNSIAVNDSVSWNMKWYARKLPSGISAEKGNNEIVNFVRNIVTQPSTDLKNDISLHRAIVYPNPASNYIIVSNLSTEHANLKIYDVCGKSLFDSNVTNNEFIQLTDLQSGIYFYLINENDVIKTGKLIIKK